MTVRQERDPGGQVRSGADLLLIPSPVLALCSSAPALFWLTRAYHAPFGIFRFRNDIDLPQYAKPGAAVHVRPIGRRVERNRKLPRPDMKYLLS